MTMVADPPARTGSLSGPMADGPDPLAGVDAIVAQLAELRPVVLVERAADASAGMLVIPAQAAGPDQINFMAKHCRGLVILALTPERVAALRLPPMVEHNNALYQQGFTTSIEARTGVSTGISAADRARTIHVAIDSDFGPDDIVTPGHVFPVTGRNGGVLARPGFTEASLELMQRAGCQNAAVLCAILDADGALADMAGLTVFARRHGLRIGAIDDLVETRLHEEPLLEPAGRRGFTSRRGGSWELRGFRNRIDGSFQLALVKGRLAGLRADDPVPLHVHALSLLDDVLEREGSGKDRLGHMMDGMAGAERAIIVLVRDDAGLFPFDEIDQRQKAYPMPRLGPAAIAAKILLQLGVVSVRLHDAACDLADTLASYGIAQEGHHG